jgi:ABC-2 type transport system permease protein
MTTTFTHTRTTMTPAHATAPPRRRDAAPGRARGSLRSSITNEWIKLRTVRSTAALLGLTAAVGALVVAGLTAAAPDIAPDMAEGLAFPVVFCAVFASVAGILVFTSDVQHGTLEPTLIAQPSRTTVAAAKATIALTFGAAIAAVGQLAGVLGGVLARADLGDGSTIVNRAAWAIAFVALASTLGLGVGMIARHSAAAISGLLVWWLVVENLIVALAPARVARLMPFVVGNGMVGIEMDSPDPELAGLTLTRTQDALILSAYATLALAAGIAVLHRQEAR